MEFTGKPPVVSVLRSCLTQFSSTSTQLSLQHSFDSPPNELSGFFWFKLMTEKNNRTVQNSIMSLMLFSSVIVINTPHSTLCWLVDYHLTHAWPCQNALECMCEYWWLVVLQGMYWEAQHSLNRKLKRYHKYLHRYFEGRGVCVCVCVHLEISSKKRKNKFNRFSI